MPIDRLWWTRVQIGRLVVVWCDDDVIAAVVIVVTGHGLLEIRFSRVARDGKMASRRCPRCPLEEPLSNSERMR